MVKALFIFLMVIFGMVWKDDKWVKGRKKIYKKSVTADEKENDIKTNQGKESEGNMGISIWQILLAMIVITLQ